MSAGARLVVVRHGQSEWNAAGIFQGQAGPGLTALGRAQAERLAGHVAARFPEVARIARSDLARVAETAAPVEARFAVPVDVDVRLRELGIGTWTGRTYAEVRAEDPPGLAAWRRGEDVGSNGGERLVDFRARVRSWCADALERVPGGTTLVITHGGVIRVLVAGVLGLAPESERRLNGPENTSVTVLERRDGELSLASYNELLGPRPERVVRRGSPGA